MNASFNIESFTKMVNDSMTKIIEEELARQLVPIANEIVRDAAKEMAKWIQATMQVRMNNFGGAPEVVLIFNDKRQVAGQADGEKL